jgi:hypothetical protein
VKRAGDEADDTREGASHLGDLRVVQTHRRACGRPERIAHEPQGESSAHMSPSTCASHVRICAILGACTLCRIRFRSSV